MPRIEPLEQTALATLGGGYSLHLYLRMGPIPALALAAAALAILVLPRRLVQTTGRDGAPELPPMLAGLATFVVLLVFVIPLQLAGTAGGMTSVLLAGTMVGMGYGLPPLWRALQDVRAVAPALIAAFGAALVLAAPDAPIAICGGIALVGALRAGLFLRSN